jgi:basic membrane protein A
MIPRRSFLAAMALGGPALRLSHAAEAAFLPAVTYDIGGKYDKSFNEAAWRGAERFKAETGIAYREFEITSPVQREQVLRALCRRGVSVIVAIGFNQSEAVTTVCREFPQVKFTIADAVADGPNVLSVVMREEEGSYLVGMLAAMASTQGKVGFIGGIDIPLIRRFRAGYRAGALSVNPAIETIDNMVGDTPTAWSDPTRGGELARAQFGRGVDVVFAAAGASGLGVYQAAKDQGKLAIGVDSNQNGIHPGTMLTSMVKHVDKVVYDGFATAHDGTWKPGMQSLGLAEGGVDWALDDNNRALITPEMEARGRPATADIVAGRIKVPNGN